MSRVFWQAVSDQLESCPSPVTRDQVLDFAAAFEPGAAFPQDSGNVDDAEAFHGRCGMVYRDGLRMIRELSAANSG